MANTLGQYLDASGVTDDKVRLRNNEPLRARNSADTADVNVLKVDSTGKVQLLTQTQVAYTPTDPSDVASVNYVDTEVAAVTYSAGDGIDITASVISVVAADSSLSVGGSGVAVALGTNPGLEISSGVKVKVADSSLGLGASGVSVTLASSSGLEISSGVKVKVDATTVKINGSGQLEGLKASNEVLTLVSGDISAGYKDLSREAYSGSVAVIAQGIPQTPTTDFTLSTVGGVTRVTFAGDLLSAQAGDKLLVLYSYL